MDQGPLVTERVDAGNRFLAEYQNCFPLKAAFWLKDCEDGEWNLFVASDQITDDNFDLAYGEVVRITGILQDPWFDLFQVKVIGVDEPLTKAVLEIQQRYPGRTPRRYHGKSMGGVTVDEVYIYPTPLAATAVVGP